MSEDTMAGSQFIWQLEKPLHSLESQVQEHSLITWDEIGQQGCKSVTGKVSIINYCQLP